MKDNLKTTNSLLLILAIPVMFYVLKVLSFIFIPLVLAIFIALLFMPLVRWFASRKAPKAVSLVAVLLIISATIFVGIYLVRLSGAEIAAGKTELYHKLDKKVGDYIVPIAKNLGIDTETENSAVKSILFDESVTGFLYNNFGATLDTVRKTLMAILMTAFFLVLLLAGSLNFKDIMRQTMFKDNYRTIKTFMTIERSIARFIKVKFWVSLGTGIGFSVVCLIFDISFPLFWGLFAFIINFVQMVGSVISTVLASLFAMIELNAPGSILGAIVLFTGVQVVFGSVVEPVLMGKSFSINVVTVLVMLMFWGFLWGIAGLILAIPMTVLMKTIFEQFESTRVVARIMA